MIIKTQLQNALDNNDINAKVLSVKKRGFWLYEIIFTRDLSYFPSEDELSGKNIVEPQEDALVEDLTEAVSDIKRILSKRAWYEKENMALHDNSPLVVEHRGYVLKQSDYTGNYTIFKDGERCMRISCKKSKITGKLTEKEAQEEIDFYIKIFEKETEQK